MEIASLSPLVNKDVNKSNRSDKQTDGFSVKLERLYGRPEAISAIAENHAGNASNLAKKREKEALEKAAETRADSETPSVRKSVNEIKTRLVKLARLEQQMAGF